MSKMQNDSKSWKQHMVRNKGLLAFWTGAWVATMALTNFGPRFLWDDNTTLTLIAVGFNLLVGFGMIMANRRHLQGMDELQQKIHLDAMGITLGVGLVCGLSYSNLDVTNLIPAHAEISHLVILMGLTYIVALFIGQRNYQ